MLHEKSIILSMDVRFANHEFLLRHYNFHGEFRIRNLKSNLVDIKSKI